MVDDIGPAFLFSIPQVEGTGMFLLQARNWFFQRFLIILNRSYILLNYFSVFCNVSYPTIPLSWHLKIAVEN